MQKLIDYIKKKKKLSQTALQNAIGVAQNAQLPLLDILYNHELVDEKFIVNFYHDVFEISLEPMPKLQWQSLDHSVLSREFCRQRTILPLGNEEDFHVALSDISDEVLLRDVEFLCEKKLKLSYCSKQKINEILDLLQSSHDDVENFEQHYGGEGRIIGLVNTMIHDAIVRRASDIHIEPEISDVAVRFRIDGVLQRMRNFEIYKEEFNAVVSRVKILANLDISEKRLPQDGRILFRQNTKQVIKDVDLRVSIVPSIQGESIVLRILDRDAALVNINSIGLSPKLLKLLKESLAKTNGMILNCGPTGSGKTTSLYAMLTHLNDSKRKILTIEDPIEYQIAGIQQIQAHQQIGLGFAEGLRAFLRHDPDVIMVGEIRDEPTAEIAIRAALTGHLVLSTLHTNDSAGAITRLLDMRMKPYLLASTISLVISQRLVRRVCPACRTENTIDAKLLNDRNLAAYFKPKEKISHAVGCSQCNQSGYKGRFAIYEFLTISENIRKAILAEKSADEINKIAATEKMQTLKSAGIDAVKKGYTTLDELFRVVYV